MVDDDRRVIAAAAQRDEQWTHPLHGVPGSHLSPTPPRSQQSALIALAISGDDQS
ncbi:hypothetical protein [Candidatus Poriferisodalis sp.]|uniref:hypothetical protein n=1 Tax=Candidatus Poriferisodalis sp. TaxID=3101277 RepID=UPI003B016D76